MKTKNERAKFEPSAKYLALEPSAFGAFFDVGDDLEEAAVDENGIAVVTIRGPLQHHASWCWDNYEDIRRRVVAALEHQDSKAVVLRIDSPGGIVAGVTECTRSIQSAKAERGKPIFAYADEQASSAAYHLACAADEIWLPETATVGSIGVICALYDTTKASEKWGERVALIASGKRKTDTYSERPLTDEIIQIAQDRVDYLAAVFFEEVAKARGTSVAKIAGLEAGVYQGNRAVKAGLADGVAGWDAFLAHVKDRIMPKSAATKTESLASALSALLATAEDPKAVLDLVAKASPAPAAAAKAKPKADDDEEEEESTDGSTTDSTDAKAEYESFITAKTGLYTVPRLIRHLQQSTGEKGIKAIFGAIDAFGQQKKAAAKAAARLEKLEARQLEQDVDAMLASAKADGRISRAQVEHLRASGMQDPKFLKGFLSQLPKLVRGSEEALTPPDGETLQLSEDQQKILAAATAGLTAEERTVFDQQFKLRSQANGATKTPTY